MTAQLLLLCIALILGSACAAAEHGEPPIDWAAARKTAQDGTARDLARLWKELLAHPQRETQLNLEEAAEIVPIALSRKPGLADPDVLRPLAAYVFDLIPDPETLPPGDAGQQTVASAEGPLNRLRLELPLSDHWRAATKAERAKIWRGIWRDAQSAREKLPTEADRLAVATRATAIAHKRQMEAMVNPKSGPEWDVPTLGDGKVEDPAPKPVSDTSPAEPGEWERLNHLVVVYATYKGLSTDLEEIILKAGVAIVIAKPSDAKSVVRDLLAEGFSPEAIAGAGLQVPDKR